MPIKSYLKIHIASVHEMKKPHTCQICDFKAVKKSELKAHNSSEHEETKDIKCGMKNIDAYPNFYLDAGQDATQNFVNQAPFQSTFPKPFLH